MRSYAPMILWTGLVCVMAGGTTARAGVSVANLTGEIQVLVHYGHEKPPYIEEVLEPFGLGQNIAFNIGQRVGVNGGAHEWTDAEGLLKLEIAFEFALGDTQELEWSQCWLRFEFDLILTDPLFQSQAGFDVVDFFHLIDPSIISEPIPPGTYHVETSGFGLGASIEGGEQGHSIVLGLELGFNRPPPPSSNTYRWVNPGGGSYGNASNWDPNTGFPVHNATQSDTALFSQLSPPFVPISGPSATAGRWHVTNSAVEFSGSASLFSPTIADPSLAIFDGGQLRLATWASLSSIVTHVGLTGALDSSLEVKGAQLTTAASTLIGRGRFDLVDGGTGTTRALYVGAGNGPGSLHVTGDSSRFDVMGAFTVGSTTAGTIEIDQGLLTVTPTATAPQIGKSAPGTVTVRGDDSNAQTYGDFQVLHTLVVGESSQGRLLVERGGRVSIAPDLVVGGYGASPSGEVVVDAQGGDNSLGVSRAIFVSATELQEFVVRNGGHATTDGLVIGSRQIRPGAADVTLQGPFGATPTLIVGSPGGGGMGTTVGDQVPGQLNVHSNATAELNGGLFVGSGAQGIVSIAGPHPTWLHVEGETQVGINAPGILQLDLDGSVDNNGDFLIGLGSGNPSGSVNLTFPSSLNVNGALHVGSAGIGLLQHGGAGIHCDTLVVGGSTPLATGILTVASTGSGSTLEVRGNAQVGVGSGRGVILLASSTASMSIDGTMTVGSPAGGAGGGAVALVDAQIFGMGNIVVNKNGSLTGTGTISVPHINAGGIISPGLSPGTLVIDGDLDLLPGGKLVMEYAGLNPGEFDVLHVTGEATLGGQLEVHFRDGFSPADPTGFIHSQDFVEADQGLIADFDRRIYAYPDEFADFDDDGDKDLSDVADFQNCVGLFGQQLWLECPRGDWEGDGVLGGVELRELVALFTGPQ